MRKLCLILCLFCVNSIFCQGFGGILEYYKDGKYGLVDSLGKTVLPVEYESVSISENKKYVVLFKKIEKERESINSDSIDRGYVLTTQDRPDDVYEYGVLDSKLDTVLPFTSRRIQSYKNYFIVGNYVDFDVLNEHFEKINSERLYAVEFITEPYSGLWYNTLTGFSGVVDEYGKTLMKEMPLWIQPISENLFVIQVASKEYFVDKKFKRVHDFSFMTHKILSANAILFNKGGANRESTKGLIDKSGTILFPAVYNEIVYYPRSEVYLITNKEYQRGLLDKNFKLILPFEYSGIIESKDSELLLVYKDKKYGFADNTGRVVIPLIYEGAQVFSEGLAAVLLDGKWGFINEKGKVVIDFQFEGIMNSFENGYAKYHKGKVSRASGYHDSGYRTTFINKKGELVGAFVNGDLTYYSVEKAIMNYDGIRRKFLVDLKTGEILIDLK